MQQALNFDPPSPYLDEFQRYRMTSLGAKAEEFHQDNPRIWNLYCRFALQAKRSGRENFGIGAITERIRWEVNIETTDADFKISNNHRAYYARKLMAEFKDLEGFFRTTGGDI